MCRDVILSLIFRKIVLIIIQIFFFANIALGLLFMGTWRFLLEYSEESEYCPDSSQNYHIYLTLSFAIVLLLCFY